MRQKKKHTRIRETVQILQQTIGKNKTRTSEQSIHNNTQSFNTFTQTQADRHDTHTRARAKKKTRKQPQIRNFKREQYNSVCVCVGVCVSARVRKKGLYILFFVCFLSG